MPLELRKIFAKENENQIFRLMGLNEKNFLKFLDEYKYLKSHKILP